MKSFEYFSCIFFIIYIMKMTIHLILDILLLRMGIDFHSSCLVFVKYTMYIWIYIVYIETVCLCITYMSLDIVKGQQGCTLSCYQCQLLGRGVGIESSLLSLNTPRTFLLQCHCTCCFLCLECCPPDRHMTSPLSLFRCHFLRASLATIKNYCLCSASLSSFLIYSSPQHLLLPTILNILLVYIFF